MINLTPLPRPLLIFTWLLFATSCVPVVSTSPSQPDGPIQDANFSDQIGNVQIGSLIQAKPVIPLGKNISLSFDMLRSDYQYLYVKVIHCDFDWKKSILSDLEFLSQYNEFPIQQYVFSQNQYQPFVTYQILLPAVTRSGNYIVALYEDETDKLLFTRRCTVFEQKVSSSVAIERSSHTPARETDHQIEFDISYHGLNVSNPNKDFKVVLLQNHCWDRAIRTLTPTSIRMDEQMLGYHHFNQENNFPGLNEFRFFDTRRLSFRGKNVNYMQVSERGIDVFLQPEKPRSGTAYSQALEKDLNGNYVVENLDINKQAIHSEYTWVNFTLESSPLPAELYIAGRFNNWSLEPANQMTYNEEKKQYEGSLLLKQGFYNYLYLTKGGSSPFYQVEESHFQTKNEYELIIYYREPGTVYDRVVGYRQF